MEIKDICQTNCEQYIVGRLPLMVKCDHPNGPILSSPIFVVYLSIHKDWRENCNVYYQFSPPKHLEHLKSFRKHFIHMALWSIP